MIEKLKNNKIIYRIWVRIREFHEKKFSRTSFYWVLYKNPMFWIKYFLRKIGIGGKKYKKIKELHNSENGRCFIVATGPSLTMEDLNKLKNEKTIGMNSLCKVFDKLGWETTYYTIQDFGVFWSMKEDIEKLKKTSLIYSDQKFKKRHMKNIMCKKYIFPRYYGNHIYHRKKLKTKFSDDVSMIVNEGYTIAFVALQLAAYMGFKEIYLIGTDCSYGKDKNQQHFVDGGYYSTNYLTIADEMMFAYRVAKEHLDRKGIKVYNATRGGALEVFPRVDLDNILTQNNV